MSSFLTALQYIPSNPLIEISYLVVIIILFIWFLSNNNLLLNLKITICLITLSLPLCVFFSSIRESNGFNLGMMITLPILSISLFNLGKLAAIKENSK